MIPDGQRGATECGCEDDLASHVAAEQQQHSLGRLQAADGADRLPHEFEDPSSKPRDGHEGDAADDDEDERKREHVAPVTIERKS